jgi:hypothetical protein
LLITPATRPGFHSANQLKVNFTIVEIDARNLNANRIPQLIGLPHMLTDKALRCVIEMIIVRRQRADMNQAFHVDVGQFDKHTKASHRGDNAREFVTNVMPQILTLQPQLNVSRRIVGTSLGHRAMLSHCHKVGHRVGIECSGFIF